MAPAWSAGLIRRSDQRLQLLSPDLRVARGSQPQLSAAIKHLGDLARRNSDPPLRRGTQPQGFPWEFYRFVGGLADALRGITSWPAAEMSAAGSVVLFSDAMAFQRSPAGRTTGC